MTGGETTIVAGIEVPSSNPFFLAVVFGVHIPLGLACVTIGAIAMLSQKRRGYHSMLGTTYFWCLLGLFASATLLSLLRWTENSHLFVLGALSFTCAWLGRAALRRRWWHWLRCHIAGMGLSYILMLVAFYVDNGKQLPVWKDLPHFTYWLVPFAIGLPLLVRALLWPPLAPTRHGL
ncbi:DUF2306 domain-containing protein [Bradyrhizobium guangdongense]|uniref:DUF2306 domain-containing protein n=1 Tax=Bradyrhizobium guangdongense TaxID=1325090 RepID=UPI001129B927|nr:DUF2306 domain-containing protein [Bradyrhizobium guangdongense]TPQ40271.1 DUF2306 domain-containing protein [Bradyrhizobium guangdongense]